MAGLKCVLFDNDGTLVDTRDIILASFHHTLQSCLGKDWPDEEILKLVGIPLSDQLPHFTDDKSKIEEMLVVYRAHNKSIHDVGIKPYQNCREALSKMKDTGLILGVTTSKKKDMCVRGLEILNIRDVMEIVVGCDETEKHKPEPDPLLYTAKELGLQPSECAYVGDAPFDVRAANSAGFTSIAEDWGMFNASDLKPYDPDYICHGWLEVADLAITLM